MILDVKEMGMENKRGEAKQKREEEYLEWRHQIEYTKKMEHFRDMKHEKEKKLRWKGTVTMDERRDSWDKKEKAGKQCIRNKKERQQVQRCQSRE